MKLVIAGTRTLQATTTLLDDLTSDLGPIDQVLTGGSRGIDTDAHDWAKIRGIPTKVFPANWSKLGKYAGPARNALMADEGDALLVIWDGRSPGSKNVMEQFTKRGKKVVSVVI